MSDQDPEDLLSRPGLEPLAILTTRSDHDPETVFKRVMNQIRSRGGPHQATSMIALTTLAHRVLTVSTIERFQEEGMFSYDEIVQQMHDAPIASRALHEAEAHGREEGLESAYQAMLEARFGEDPRIPLIAESLACLPRATAARAVLAAGSVDELLS